MGFQDLQQASTGCASARSHGTVLGQHPQEGTTSSGGEGSAKQSAKQAAGKGEGGGGIGVSHWTEQLGTSG